ncbi:hypothetical protein KFE25_002091 [Diacronema lutheri]|uniref:Acyltransferase 3 domain-containing protein n=2 Tax=Diacronema lutheri TaxID=2081491 RepID=A0A8J5XR18_DIALT|nr:hypothetical protein KFE25_002091 [Diacronema lutheri]
MARERRSAPAAAPPTPPSAPPTAHAALAAAKRWPDALGARFSCKHICPRADKTSHLPTHRLHEGYLFVTVDQSASIVALLVVFALGLFGARRVRALIAARRNARRAAPPRGADGHLESQEHARLHATDEPASDAREYEHVGAIKAGAAAAAANPEAAPRTPLHAIDHAKFFLNVAILTNHCFNRMHHAHNFSPWSLAYYCWSESFVMPTFALVSGFLTKGEFTPERAQRHVATVWAPFVVMHVLSDSTGRLRAAVERAYEHGSTLGEFVLSCRWPFPNMVGAMPSVAWYLQCWIVWKLLLPSLAVFGRAGGAAGKARMLAVAVAISWMGGYWAVPQGAFHMDSTISLLALFVLGHVLPHSLLARVTSRVRCMAACVHVAYAIAIVALAYGTFVPCTEPSTGEPLTASSLVVWAITLSRRSYFQPLSGALERACGERHDSCGREYYLFWTQRAVQQLLAALLGGTFILAMPNWQTCWSRHGRHSLYAYLMQTSLFLPFVPHADMLLLAWLDAIGVHVPGCASALNMPKMAVYSLGATFAMTSETCRSLTCAIFEPTYLNWLWGLPYRRLPHGRSLLFFLVAAAARGAVSEA